MEKIAVIGAGISGLSIGQLLCNNYNVTLYEKESEPGGLIRCKRVDGSLYHLCGGHVFNSKRQDVLDWFWNFFDRNMEFTKVDRNSVAFFEEPHMEIPYPIENNVYLMDVDTQKAFINDLITIALHADYVPSNFEEFLKHRFGSTLYKMYFQPYNEKVWRRNLCNVPLSWLEGKLPMPSIQEMIFNNMNHVKEHQFVHSSFWYAKKNGSQFLADRLSEGLNIRYNTEIKKLKYDSNSWSVNGEVYDAVVFCGNIKMLPSMLEGVNISNYVQHIDSLEYHGTTSVFCEIDNNPYSWIYQPSRKHKSHRIICTGNFSLSNNTNGKMTGSIEFTDSISEDEIKKNLQKIPLHPVYLDSHYNKCTYPIQDKDTREMILCMKNQLAKKHFFFTGRFADWEYYNMDVAIAAAMATSNNYFFNNK